MKNKLLIIFSMIFIGMFTVIILKMNYEKSFGKTESMRKIQQRCGISDSDVMRTTAMDKIWNCLNK